MNAYERFKNLKMHYKYYFREMIKKNLKKKRYRRKMKITEKIKYIIFFFSGLNNPISLIKTTIFP